MEDTLYSYDQFGNLLSVELPDGGLIEYIVDGQNRRVGKKVDGEIVERMIYQDELNPVAIVDAYGRVQTRFVYGELGHVPSYMIKDGERYAIITDNVGSPIMVVRESDGFIAQRRSYDAWGNVLEDTNPGFQPFGFAGGLYDGATGLIRYGARDYDPAIGRWTNKDPIRFAGGDLNLYAYAFNDPINNIDPTGLACGPGDVGDKFVPDRIPFVCDFRAACEQHDLGYATTDSKGNKTEYHRKKIDDKFLEDMLFDSCPRGHINCYMIALVYYDAVRKLGRSAYYRSSRSTKSVFPPVGGAL